MIVVRLANECWCSFQILRVMCSERPWRKRLLAKYVRVVVSRLMMIGEEMRGRPLGRLTYHVLGSKGDLEMLLDADLVRERVVGGCAVG